MSTLFIRLMAALGAPSVEAHAVDELRDLNTEVFLINAEIQAFVDQQSEVPPNA